MPFDARFLHWQQTADDELLSTPGEVRSGADEVSRSDVGLAEMRCEVAYPWESATSQEDTCPSL